MASCPLGFGGPSQGKGELSPYHCVLCRGLLHKPVACTPCRHVFCSFCIRKFRDCPVCGADIDSTSPDSALEASIEKVLVGHAKLSAKAARTPSACPAARDPAAAASGLHPGAASCPAFGNSPIPGPLGGSGTAFDLPSLLLQLALQSLAGGNPEAALSRLDMCAEALCSAAEASAPSASSAPDATFSPVTADGGPARPNASPGADAGTSAGAGGVAARGDGGAGPTNQVPGGGAHSGASASTISPPGPPHTGGDSSATSADAALRRQLAAARTDADTASRLGAVLGCQADCYRRLGDPAGAHLRYTSSLACLAPWRGRSREADSALSVTHNKLGDLMLVAGQLADAKEHYEQALDIRRRVVAAGAGAEVAAEPWATEMEAEAVEAAGGGEGAGRVRTDGSQRSSTEAGQGEVKAAEPAGVADAMCRGGAGVASEETVVQELCDLATSLCKVADVWLCLRDEQASQAQEEEEQQQQQGQEREQQQARGQESGAGTAVGEEREQQQDAGEGQAVAGAASGVPEQPPQQAQPAQQGPQGLLAEARRVLLRPELLPYARACGLAPAQGPAGARTAEAPPPSAQPDPTTAGSPAEATAQGRAGSAAVDPDAHVDCGGRTASTAPEAASAGEPAAAALSQQLVYRYMRVWGAMEQLMARLGSAVSE